MREKSTSTRGKNQLKSVLLVFVIVASSMVVILPLTAPEVKGQVVHLASAFLEDQTGLPYDIGPVGDNEVIWDPAEDHHIDRNYTVDAGYTLIIPALNYMGDPATGQEITFTTANTTIDVYGRLITSPHTDQLSRTLFWGEDTVNWKGITFQPDSEGCITECIFRGATDGVMFTRSWPPNPEAHPKLMYPGITRSSFEEMGDYGLRLYGVRNYTYMEDVTFLNTYDSAYSLRILDTDLNMLGVTFNSHPINYPSLYIGPFFPSKVNATNCVFLGNGIPGNAVLIKDNHEGTRFNQCAFNNGAPDDHYIRVDGSEILLDNCSFDLSHGELSVIANEYFGRPTNLVVRNPTADGAPGFWDATFDNTTMNATDNSTVTLQWYMNVYVDDPLGNFIKNAPVWVNDTLGNPAKPHSIATDASGWAKWFTVTELTKYNDSMDYYSPFNVSTMNNSMMGFADPEPVMNMSKEINVTVPFNPIPNTPPNVTWITTPGGIQYGDIPSQYRLEDQDPGDDGNMSVLVYYSTDGMNWFPAMGGGGDPTTGLKNNTVYTFIWDSASKNLKNRYNTTVFIKIVPKDRVENGTPNQTGNFTVDNKVPVLSLPPIVSGITNTTVTITWSADENCNATVWYGFYGDGTTADLTFEETGSVLTTGQSVTLTELQPGRKYTFVVNSTDSVGFTTSSEGELPDDENYTFETEVYIQLYDSIIWDFDTVWCYFAGDPSGDIWKVYDVNKPFGNDLTQIIPGAGVWIHMLNDTVLMLDHTPDMAPPWKEMGLFYGWNYIGYNSAQIRTIQEALDNRGVNYEIVRTYDAASGQWLFSDGPGGAADTLTHMKIGKGYWIFVTDFIVWSLPYAE
jgi:hypothetical protein